MTDGNGCTATLSIAIAEPVALALSETHTDVLCNSGTTGTIDLTVSGGILPMATPGATAQRRKT
ncbi:MAG: SprB repeat-containing protein [Bacteroidetes bacterium]|nr:SprB repeat-containing protein [Bacteroidota bacterium]